jgi:hypothetical protein
MKAKRFRWHWGSTVLAALALAFSGLALAAPIAGQAPAKVIYAKDAVVQAAGDQDPNTPPDCKKYPKDTRCTVKK